MLVETPQILWNAAQGESRRRPNHSKSKAAARSSSTTTTTTTAMNAALYSLDLMPSGLPEPYNHILVTAGNAAQVNVWSLLLLPTTSTTSTSTTSTSTPTMFQRKPTRLAPSHSAPTGSGPVTTTTNNNTTTTTTSTTASQGGTMGTSSSSSGGLSYRYSLGRSLSGVAVQSCKFAPNGLFLAVASDAGTMLHLYSVPWQKRGNGNGRHYWNLTASAADLQSQLVRGTAGEGLVDVSWSADSQRLVLANIDHSVTLVQRVETTPNTLTTTSTNTSTVHGGGEDWQVVLRIAEHHHYVQGVAYDPLGVYLASMSHDRTVRLYPRKATAKTLKKVLAAAATVNTVREDHDHDASASASSSPTTNNNTANNATTAVSVAQPPPHPRDIVQAWLSQSKFEVAKTRVLKYAPRPVIEESTMTSTTMTTTTDLTSSGASGGRQYWFADEATVESFFRRLAWTVDGQYLLCPTALYKTTPLADTNKNNNNHGSTQHAVLMFRRHEFEEPHRIVTGLTRPAVAIVPNPVLFALPATQQSRRQPQQEDSNSDNNNKENEPRRPSYRSLFAVLTWDCVVIYDTVSTHPLAYVSGLHYANFTDGAWSANGHDLLVSSSDGYVSLIHFEPGELGTPLRASSSSLSSVSSFRQTVPTATPVPLPPCDPGPVQLPTHRPAKKAKVVVVPETPDTQDGANPSPPSQPPQPEDHPMDQDSPNVTTDHPPEEEESGRKRLDPPPQPLAAQAIQKKKKRIQPTLVVAAATPH